MNFIKCTIYATMLFYTVANTYGYEEDHMCDVIVSHKVDGKDFNFTERDCCDGYEKDSNGDCKPRCDVPCKRGAFCKAPNVCECIKGYQLKDNTCSPICKNKCIDGFCFKPGVCMCPQHFKMDPNNSTLCLPICNPICPQHSKCTKSHSGNPNHCQCLAGYSENNKTKSCDPVCKNECINGFCSLPDTCTCFEGFELDIKYKTNCKPKCEKCPQSASCVAPNICECNDNKYKYNAINNVCDPICDNLIENSKCVQPNKWECNDDYKHDNNIEKCVLKSCLCKSNGYCLKDEHKCECYKGFTKNITTGQCEAICQPECINSVCVENNICECLDGYHSTQEDHICEQNELCRGKPCKNGECLLTGECKCKTGFMKSLSLDGYVQCDKDTTFVAKIMTSIIGVPLLLGTCILIAVYCLSKKKSHNVEDQEMMLIGRH